MNDDTPEDAPAEARERGDASLIAFIVAPIAVLGVSYLVDAILGTKSVIFAGTPGRGVERFAAITAAVCLIEFFAVAVILVRAHRPVALLVMSIYLMAIAGIALFFGTFRA